jgi:hypothetical protein
MDVFQQIAENRIREAMEEGLFEQIPGKGKPFRFEDDSMVPEDLRQSHKILKNAHCLPAELELRKDIFNIRQMLESAVDEETRMALQRKLNSATLALDMRRTR